jgi:uncharacterized membrane protein YciS (DUF1049 family)
LCHEKDTRERGHPGQVIIISFCFHTLQEVLVLNVMVDLISLTLRCENNYYLHFNTFVSEWKLIILTFLSLIIIG